MDDFRYKRREAITCYHESTPWAVSKDKWDTKENNMMRALYILWYATEAMSSSKNCSLSCY